MIIPMAKVRVLGPREAIDAALRAVQDFGLLHLGDASRLPGLDPPALDARTARHRRHALRTLDDIDDALNALGPSAALRGDADAALRPGDAVRWARNARRTGRAARRLAGRAQALEEERRLLERYREFLAAIRPVLARLAGTPRLTSYAVVVPASGGGALDVLLTALRAEIGPEFASAVRVLPGGDVAVLLVLPLDFARRLEAKLAEARVPEIPLPAAYQGAPLSEAVPRMIARLERIPRDVAEVEREQRRLAESQRDELTHARVALHDWLARIDAHLRCGVTARAFALEGWLPVARVGELRRRVRERAGDAVVVEEIARESWAAEDAPVVLSNPRIFRPFESIVRILPLPRYGSLDPTPYVAVFFPMMFGMMMGDIGYGLVLAAAALVVHRRTRPGSLPNVAAEIAGPCAAFAIVFGALYGELFGDLGRRWFGVHALAFDREESILAAMAVTMGLGLVHVLLGLVLGVVSAARHEPRQALGRGISAVMVLLVVVALLVAFEVLPSGLMTPTVIALLVAFPVLILVEGFLAPIELLATLGNVLSYVRIMALGTASVMLAVVANRMVGTIGSTVVGFVFALLFHLVNFAIGVFSPSVHAMRLHFVEFFGKFYSPGGRRYEPFGHWRPSAGH
ncbi:MAG TPA: V-type ATPase 116kDa subunit family protein [Gemmatimonadaceae bacterium]|nr:V-type ATPase 116kDa subunit family protein [Gemmatimonadaceae bacterium]